MRINGRDIGPGRPVYIIAELSANHNGSLDEALRLVHAAKEAGADAVKLQTYTADTMTLKSDKPWFRIGQGTIWEGRNLHDLYQEAYTPWEWCGALFALARQLGLDCFSTPFDDGAVDFLESFDPPAYKIASFELIDDPLLKKVAATKRPVILSTGMATLGEIDHAVSVLRDAGCVDLALLKCSSAYPADPSDMNLKTISHMAEAFGVPVGLSDHTLGTAAAIAATALGATIIEKHFTLSRSIPGPDADFSLEPDEFKRLVQDVRLAWRAMGGVSYQVSEREAASRVFRRSLFVSAPIRAGEPFTRDNVRCVRPGAGLSPSRLEWVLGRVAAIDLDLGDPLDEAALGGPSQP